MQEPPKGITTNATVVRVIDGDTVDLKIEKIIRVRLLDCWAPETRTRDAVEKEKGYKSKKYLISLLKDQYYNDLYASSKPKKEIVVHIPADAEDEIKDVFTFSRVLGRIFVGGQDVSELMVEAGMASSEK